MEFVASRIKSKKALYIFSVLVVSITLLATGYFSVDLVINRIINTKITEYIINNNLPVQFHKASIEINDFKPYLKVEDLSINDSIPKLSFKLKLDYDLIKNKKFDNLILYPDDNFSFQNLIISKQKSAPKYIVKIIKPKSKLLSNFAQNYIKSDILGDFENINIILSDKFKLEYFGIKINNLELQNINDASLIWIYSDDMHQVKLANEKFKILTVFDVTKDNNLNRIKSEFTNISLDILKDNLPKNILSKRIEHILNNALHTGIFSGQLNYNQNTQDLNIAADFQDLDIDYNMRWPQLTSLAGTVDINNKAIKFSANAGKFAQVSLQSLTGELKDYNNTDNLEINAKLVSDLPTFEKALDETPLHATLGDSIRELNLLGLINADLNFNISLNKPPPNKVISTGQLTLTKASLESLEYKIKLTDLNGVINYKKNTFESDVLRAKFANNHIKLKLSGIHEKDLAKINLAYSGEVQLHNLTNYFNLTELNNYIFGHSEVVGQLDFDINPDKKNINFSLNSDLHGVGFDFPAPLFKSKQTLAPVQIKFCKKSYQENQLDIKYSDEIALKAKILHDKLQSGHVRFGASSGAKFRDDNILLIDGLIDDLDLSLWRKIIPNLKFLKNAKPKEFSFDPIFDLNIDNLLYDSIKFNNVNIGVRYDDLIKLWSINLNSDNIKGSIELPQLVGNYETGLIVNLKYLDIKTKDQSDITTKFKNSFKPINSKYLGMPVNINIAKLNIFDRDFDNFKLNLYSNGNNYIFDDLSFNFNGGRFLADGKWHYKNSPQIIEMDGAIYAKNSTGIWQTLKRPGTIFDAKGLVEFYLSWQDPKFPIDYNNIFAQAKVNLKNGYIQGIDPGFGKILSLLNLDNLHKRLSLDFSDLTKKGLSFNTLNGNYLIANNVIITNDTILDGSSVKIEANGELNLANSSLNGNLDVMPNLTGSLPVATAIVSANPAVGAAFWAFDKVFGKRIQQINKYSYKLTGTWQAPRIYENNNT